MDIGIRCDHFLSMAQGKVTPERDIFLGIHKGKIVEVCPWRKRPLKTKPKTFIHAQDKVVLPGLVNGHTHLPMTLFRGLEDDLPLHQWLFDCIIPLEGKLVNRAFVKTGTELAACESIRFGVTTVCDMYYFASTVAEVLDRAGLRGIVCQVWGDYPFPEDAALGKDRKASFRKLHAKYGGHERITPGVAPHSPYTCNDENLKEAAELAREYNTPIHIHLNETAREIQDAWNAHGKSATQRLIELGIIHSKTVCAHCVHMNEEEFHLFKQSGAAVASNPDSNLKLSSGIAPVSRYLNEGIRVAWGTDGSASNNDLSLFGAMDIGTKLQKFAQGSNTAMIAEQALLCATWGGAHALGLGHQIGSLEVGKSADLIAVDLNFPHLQPLHCVVSQLVYATQGLEVDTVICQGRILMKDKKMKTLNPSQIFKDAEKFRKKIQESL